jgi:hypothetical protein
MPTLAVPSRGLQADSTLVLLLSKSLVTAQRKTCRTRANSRHAIHLSAAVMDWALGIRPKSFADWGFTDPFVYLVFCGRSLPVSTTSAHKAEKGRFWRQGDTATRFASRFATRPLLTRNTTTLLFLHAHDPTFLLLPLSFLLNPRCLPAANAIIL